ncbi:MAG: VirB4 family type IV secretion system protein, partial [Thermovenabulum sp.]
MKLLGKHKKEKEIVDVEEKRAMNKGVTTILDTISPDGVLITPSYIQLSSNRYVKSFFVSEVPSTVFVGWLDELYLFGDVDISIYVYPYPNREAIKDLTQKIEDLMAQQILDERRGDYTNASLTKITLEDAWRLREEIQTNRNKMYNVTILFTIAAKTPEELERKSKIIEERLGGMAINIREAFLRQDDCLKSVMPLGNNKMLDIYRNYDLGAATSLLPFNNADITHEGGVYLGLNITTGAPVFFNPFNKKILPNPHLGVIATTGAGKTTFLKLYTSRSAIYGIKTVFIDVENEFGKMVENLGGVHVKLSPNEAGYINPFEIEEDYDDDTRKSFVNLRQKIADLKGLFSVMIEGQNAQLTPIESVIIEDTIREEYEAIGITTDPESLYEYRSEVRDGVYTAGKVKKKMPTISSFYERLKTKGEGAERLVKLLKQYLKDGSLGLFDGETKIDLKDATMISFDISKLEEKFMKPFAMYVIL